MKIQNLECGMWNQYSVCTQYTGMGHLTVVSLIQEEGENIYRTDDVAPYNLGVTYSSFVTPQSYRAHTHVAKSEPHNLSLDPHTVWSRQYDETQSQFPSGLAKIGKPSKSISQR